MTPLVMLLLFNAGMLMGFFVHSLLSRGGREDLAPVFVETSSSFRDDLLLPILPSKNRYLH
jgi:hypothetical protein